MEQDIRWRQRFSNFRKALSQLTKFIEKGSLSELEEQGLIKAFEYTYELGWNSLKDYLEYQGISNLVGSRSAIKEAFKQNLLGETEAGGTIWIKMIESRNMTSHAYNESVVKELSLAILSHDYAAFKALELRLTQIANSAV